ncbi:hypothetical protein QQG74_21550 [Micromonospora sp. FIMYZ51]|uniref:hypothetical protein n=1 Tax=Micromonospora sp. FIMYZ51 TaxID=3051832 RepID=UPI00311FBAB5
MPRHKLPAKDKIDLSSTRIETLRRQIITEKLGDKLIIYLCWTWLAPLAAIVAGSLGGIEAIKPAAVYTFNMGVVLAGVGELLTKSAELHRRMHVLLLCSMCLLISLMVVWVKASSNASGTGLASEWRSVMVASALTATVVGADIVIGVTRDAYEEVKSWTKEASPPSSPAS